MRTTLDIDERLLDTVLQATGERSKSAAVNKVLGDYIRQIKIDEIRAAAGKFQLDDTRAEQRAADWRRQEFLDKLRSA